MAHTLEAIIILLIVWQMMTRFRKSDQIDSNEKSKLQGTINDAKNRMPSTGLFALFKGKSSNPKPIDEPEIEIEQTIVPIKGDKKENST